MATFPTSEQIDIAAMWLQSNEGDGGERESCVAVANWLIQESANRYLRSEVRRARIPVAAVRERMK